MKNHRLLLLPIRPIRAIRGRLVLSSCLCACVPLFFSSCRESPPPTDHFALVVGSFGHSSGKFNRPRGIACEPAEDAMFVVDWDGRVQKFTTDGRFRASWIMPEVEKGKPEDLCVTPDGRLLVADTHYSRIVAYTLRGEFIRSWGSYGRDPGQFIYPVGIACDTNGNFYVSEYGENDRVQKFAPDGRFLLAWGSFGAEPGRFQRPSGLDVSSDNRVFVADAVNHRVQVFDTEGRLLSVIGREGTAPGAFRYPYDVAVRGEHLFVLEYGNQRVQKLTRDGKPVSSFGRPGRGDGCFASPWRCAIVKNRVYVSDTENSRVVGLGETF